MKANVFIVDVLVNATGATIILFFLFVVRIAPGNAALDPRFANATILWLDVVPLTRKPIEGDDPFDYVTGILRVSSSKGGGPLLVIGNKHFPDHSAPPSVLGLVGEDETIREAERMIRVIAPCPETGAQASLELIYPKVGAPDAIGPLDLEVKAFLYGPKNGIARLIGRQKHTLKATVASSVQFTISGEIACNDGQ